MRHHLLLTSLLLGTTICAAARLKLQVNTTPERIVVREICLRPQPTNGKRDVVVERQLSSGTLTFLISGGVPPYRVHYADRSMTATEFCDQVSSGRHHIVVEDATGDRVWRTVHVGSSTRYVRIACPLEPEGPPASSPMDVMAEENSDPRPTPVHVPDPKPDPGPDRPRRYSKDPPKPRKERVVSTTDRSGRKPGPRSTRQYSTRVRPIGK